MIIWLIGGIALGLYALAMWKEHQVYRDGDAATRAVIEAKRQRRRENAKRHSNSYDCDGNLM